MVCSTGKATGEVIGTGKSFVGSIPEYNETYFTVDVDIPCFIDNSCKIS